MGLGRKRAKNGAVPSLFPMEADVFRPDTGSDLPKIERWETPSTWIWVTMGEVGDVKAGLARTPKNRPGQSPTKYLRTANITEEGLDLEELLEMDTDAEEREVFALRVGDVVVTESSGSPEHVGKSALWRGEIPVCCFQNHVLRLRPMGISSEYSLIVIQHYWKNGLLAGLLRGIGINHLGVDNFSRLPFPLPPRNEQDRIVAEFAIQDERVKVALASLSSAKGKLRLQRQAIVRHELGIDDSRSPKLKSTLQPGWERARLGDICEAVNGRAFKSSEWQDSGLPIIRIQNLRDETAEFNHFGGEVEERHIVDEGDLLFAWSGTPGTSFGAFIWRRQRGVLNQHIFKLIPDQGRVNSEYLYYAINQNLDSYVEAAQGGGGLAHLTRNQFLDSEVILAPLSEQLRIVETIRAHQKSLDQQEAVVEQNVQRTGALRQALLVHAVKGMLVEQDEKDGSSAHHLAEIGAEMNRYKKELKGRRQILKASAVSKKESRETVPKRDIHEVLVELGPLSVQDLFKKAGYREEKLDEVEAFYRLLDSSLRSKRVTAESGSDPECTRLKAEEA